MLDNKHTYEDGLNILRYLGLTNLSAEEREAFERRWESVYQMQNGNVIQTTRILYSRARNHQDSWLHDYIPSQIREIDFFLGLAKSDLSQKLSKKIPLGEIVSFRGRLLNKLKSIKTAFPFFSHEITEAKHKGKEEVSAC